VSDWPERLALTLAMVGVIALVCWGMWRGWRGRGERQSGLVAPHQPTALQAAAVAVAACEGRYVGTVRDGDWLDRIVVHGLGTPSRCQISVTHDGVIVARNGADGFFIPRSDLVKVGSGKGIAGEVVESGGLGIITWRLGDTVLATGFRADSAVEQQAVLSALAELISSATAGGQ
jgi:hypothetical protein